ncbi:MAG: MBOAT family O-acyltransferase [Pseudolabrys sp.]|nr:MBOAT family O-acyltransferase [Pseudolabrys sp.]
MLFNSYVFLGIFLPLTLAGYYGLLSVHRRSALVWVVVASLVFYGHWDWRFLPLICGSIAFNYALSRYIARSRSILPLTISVAVNLSVLGFFKYSLFLMDVAGFASDAPQLLRNVILPLGISFWTFQQIAYLVDVHRGRVAPAPIDAHAFSMLFFPHLIAGPILLYVNISRQYLRPAWPSGFLARSFQVGTLIFAIGLFKKVAIADSLAPFAEPVFNRAATGAISPSDAWIGAIAYSLQLYFDFSGYSDMAYGLARMFGFRIPINFLSPYKAVSILDFWQRWHRSLTAFFRSYVYIPLGGNRVALPRQTGNVLFVFLLTGFWHGAGWTFIAWGAGHGVLVAAAHLWRKSPPPWMTMVPTWIRRSSSRLATLAAVLLLWVLFRAESFESAMRVYAGMAFITHAWSSVAFPDLGMYRDIPLILGVAGAGALGLPNTFEISRMVRRWAAEGQKILNPGTLAGSALVGVCLYVAISSLARKEATFLYYNF